MVVLGFAVFFVGQLCSWLDTGTIYAFTAKLAFSEFGRVMAGDRVALSFLFNGA